MPKRTIAFFEKMARLEKFSFQFTSERSAPVPSTPAQAIVWAPDSSYLSWDTQKLGGVQPPPSPCFIAIVTRAGCEKL